MNSTDTTLPYDSPLELSMLDGDLTGLMDLVDAMSPAERASSWAVVERIVGLRWEWLRSNSPNPFNTRPGYGPQSSDLLDRAIHLARFLCVPEHPLAEYWQHIDIRDIAVFKQRYKPEPAAPLTEKQLRGDHQWYYRNHVHRAVIAGQIERPQTEEYLQSLFFGDLRRETNIILKHVAVDPGLAPYLLQLFDREGPSDASFAAVEKYCHRPELTWTHAFLTLCERGVYSRMELLDKTLGTLASDWPQFKSSWFSHFHERLAPSLEELTEFAPRYLALCHSRIGPTAALALDAVEVLYKAGRVDDERICEAMQPLIMSPTKGRVLSVLELLKQVVRKSPALTMTVSAIAAHALAHPGVDVQKKAIASLRDWGLDEAGEAVAHSYLPFVSAVNRPALAALLGEADTVERVVASQDVLVAAPPLCANLSSLDPTRSLKQIVDVPTLVERLSYVVENPAEVDEWERVVEALSRMAPLVAQNQQAFLALKKRAKRLLWSEKPLGFAAALIMAIALGEDASDLIAVIGSNQSRNSVIACRAYSIAMQLAASPGLPLLSSPTHCGGFIDPRILVARIADYQQRGKEALMSEQVFALMRLVPADRDEGAARSALQEARGLKALPVVQALRYALGDAVVVPSEKCDQALWVAAARIRSPGGDDAGTLAAYGCLGPDGPRAARFRWQVTTREPNSGGYVFHDLQIACEPPPQIVGEHHYGIELSATHMIHERWQQEGDASAICFAASLQPSTLESFFAKGARAIGDNLDWWEAQWHNRAYLDLLLQPTTLMTPMAYLTLALALAGKEPGQTALAIDALSLAVQDGRLNMASFGETLARLWATPIVKGPRYAKSLAAAAQAHAGMPRVVFSLLCAMIEVPADPPRKDLAPLLELLLELKLAHQQTLPASTRAALAAMRFTGKSKAAVQSILA